MNKTIKKINKERQGFPTYKTKYSVSPIFAVDSVRSISSVFARFPPFLLKYII